METVTDITSPSNDLLTTFKLTYTPTPDDEFKFENRAQRLIVAMIFIIVSIIGTIGNSLVIVSVAVARKLRTITNVFVVNLAVADLLTSISLPWNAVALISQNGWPLHPVICTLAGAIMYLCIIASFYSLASIGVNRYILITKKHITYQRIFTKFNLAIWLIMIWVISFFLIVFLPVVDIGGLGYNEKYSICGQSSSHPQDDIYQLVQAMGSFPIPLIIICYSYIKIFLHVRKHMRVMSRHMSCAESNVTDTTAADIQPERVSSIQAPHTEKQQRDDIQTNAVLRTSEEANDGATTRFAEQELNANNNTNNISSNNSNSSRSSTTKFSLSFKGGSRVNKRNMQITKNMFLVVCIFFVCIAPFTFCLFFDDSDPFVPYASALVLCNAAVNPFIYATKHPVFKTVMKGLIRCQTYQRP